ERDVFPGFDSKIDAGQNRYSTKYLRYIPQQERGLARQDLPRAGVDDHPDLLADRLDLRVAAIFSGHEPGRAEQIEDGLVRWILGVQLEERGPDLVREIGAVAARHAGVQDPVVVMERRAGPDQAHLFELGGGFRDVRFPHLLVQRTGV